MGGRGGKPTNLLLRSSWIFHFFPSPPLKFYFSTRKLFFRTHFSPPLLILPQKNFVLLSKNTAMRSHRAIAKKVQFFFLTERKRRGEKKHVGEEGEQFLLGT